MKVEVRLFATLKDLLPEDKSVETIELEKGSTVNDIIRYYEVPEMSLIIRVNGRHASRDKVLSDGDRVGIFPPVGGG